MAGKSLADRFGLSLLRKILVSILLARLAPIRLLRKTYWTAGTVVGRAFRLRLLGTLCDHRLTRQRSLGSCGGVAFILGVSLLTSYLKEMSEVFHHHGLWQQAYLDELKRRKLQEPIEGLNIFVDPDSWIEQYFLFRKMLNLRDCTKDLKPAAISCFEQALNSQFQKWIVGVSLDGCDDSLDRSLVYGCKCLFSNSL